MQTFYWHDYETWGVNPASDMPSQFAGVRTDYDFNIIGEPLNILCKPSLDVLPHAEACLVTGLTPQQAEQQGVAERDFFAAIHAQLAQANTCAVGYNSVRFDDEVTRYGLYRNFYDPYAREWQNGNSRWDIIDMLRLCYAVRPEGIVWPTRVDDGKTLPVFKLEKLTEKNGLAHEAAHDALSDVYATIAIAKLIKTRQPELFNHVLGLRSKQAVQHALDLGSGKPRLHISARFGAQFANGSLILPVTQHPINKNEILCVDLRYSPQPLFDLPADEIAKLLYTRIEDLPDDIERIPLKSVHLNRCPVVLSTGLLNDAVVERMQLDLAQCEKHRQQLLADKTLIAKLQTVSRAHTFQPRNDDVETQLYAGFFSNQDRQTCQQIPALNGEQLATQTFSFEDARLPELLFRYRAKNFPASLGEQEISLWQEHCRAKLLGEPDKLSLEMANVERLLKEQSNAEKQRLLMQLKAYLSDKKQALSL